MAKGRGLAASRPATGSRSAGAVNLAAGCMVALPMDTLNTARPFAALCRAALLLPLVLLAACASLPSPVAGEAPRLDLPSVGEVWRYRELNGFRNEPVADVTFTVTRADTNGIDLSVGVSGMPLSALRDGQTERYLKPWDVAEDAIDRVRRYEPALPLLRTDAPLGARVDDRARVERPPTRQKENWTALSRFVGWESVTVPAGTFRAARYERVSSYFDADVFRWRTERRETLWFVPEIRHWVKREVSGTWTRPIWQRGRRWDLMRDDWIVWELTGHAR